VERYCCQPRHVHVQGVQGKAEVPFVLQALPASGPLGSVMQVSVLAALISMLALSFQQFPAVLSESAC
jgi:hypothetical protein